MWMPKSGADLLRLECSPAPENTPSEKKAQKESLTLDSQAFAESTAHPNGQIYSL